MVQKLSISIRIVSTLKTEPFGNCIQPLAIRIHMAEILVPRAMRNVQTQCPRRLSRFQPKKKRPAKVDSMKNATRASIASGAPKISPT